MYSSLHPRLPSGFVLYSPDGFFYDGRGHALLKPSLFPWLSHSVGRDLVALCLFLCLSENSVCE